MRQLNIGQKVRQIRRERKLTLQVVAELTGFTKSYLSMVELEKKSPPIASLSKIAHALQVDISEFFNERRLEERIAVIRREERKSVARNGTVFGYKYESLAPAMQRRKRMEPFIITYPPGNRSGNEKTHWFDHEGEEFLFVLQGTITVFFGDKKYTLRKGDCVYFDSSIPHTGEGVGKEPAIALVVVFSAL